MKPHLQCAEQQVSRSNLTKYCACHAERLTYLVLITYETSFTVRGATGVTIQPHQILRLPRKMTRLLYRPHIWNVISNARSNRCHYPTSPNTAPATKNDTARFQRKSPKTDETSFPMRGRSEHDPTMIRPWSDHENANRNPPRKWGYFSSSPRAFSIEKYNVSRPILHSNLHQILRLPRKVPLELHQILRLSRRKTHILSPHRIWNVIYSARSNRCHHPTSPNTAPATKNDSTALSSSHMKRHFQCAEQQVSPSNLTKYCACHEKWLDCFIVLTYETSFPMRGATGVTIQPHQILRLPRKMTLQDFKENLQKQVKRHFQCGADPSMIRPWSDHDPTMKTQTATRLASEVTFRAHHEHFLLKNTTFRAQSYIQTFTKYCACHVKCHLNFTKYCACHAERLTYLVLIAYETSFTVRGATGVTIQPHQILRLPRKMTRLLYRPHIWNVISNARSNRCHHPTSPNTAPATKNDSTALSSSHMKRHFQCAEQQVSLSNLTKYCACHEKWHCKISKKISKNRWNVISNAGPIRPWSEHENANRNPPRKWGYFSSSPRAFSIEKYNVSRPILHSNLHQILRLPRKVPLELHQILRLPRKVTLELHQVLRLPRQVTLELHQVLRRPLYCDWTLLYSTLLDTTLRDTTLRDTTLRDTTLLDSTLLDSTLLDSTWHYSTWHYSTWLLFYLTLLYLTCSTWLNFTEMLFVYRKFLNLNFLWQVPFLFGNPNKKRNKNSRNTCRTSRCSRQIHFPILL